MPIGDGNLIRGGGIETLARVGSPDVRAIRTPEPLRVFDTEQEAIVRLNRFALRFAWLLRCRVGGIVNQRRTIRPPAEHLRSNPLLAAHRACRFPAELRSCRFREKALKLLHILL